MFQHDLIHEHNIKNFTPEKNFKYELYDIRFDFWGIMNEIEFCIEIDDIGHLSKENIKKDKMKNEFCKTENIKLLRVDIKDIKYNKMTKIYLNQKYKLIINFIEKIPNIKKSFAYKKIVYGYNFNKKYGTIIFSPPQDTKIRDYWEQFKKNINKLGGLQINRKCSLIKNNGKTYFELITLDINNDDNFESMIKNDFYNVFVDYKNLFYINDNGTYKKFFTILRYENNKYFVIKHMNIPLNSKEQIFLTYEKLWALYEYEKYIRDYNELQKDKQFLISTYNNKQLELNLI